MKRLVVAAIVGAAVLLVPAAPAVAKADPVKALKARFATGKGVKVSNLLKISAGGQALATMREVGLVGFGRSGVAATDIRDKAQYSKVFLDALPEADREKLRKAAGVTRMISTLQYSYISGARVREYLPPGKTWVRKFSAGAFPGSLLVNPFEPRTLDEIIDRASSRQGSVIKGRISSVKLARVSPSFRSIFGEGGKTREGATAKVNYTVWLDARGQVKRVYATMTVSVADTSLTYASDGRVSGWGGKVVISEPPASSSVDEGQLGDGALDDPGPVQIPG
ncbi:hypothetical protein Acor_15550 [Acrocarpospora corrugata]|uniref:Lipoprotein n=1 Tax=Acrocarpospora corrugata TaxID=35763 RepID=A0A5M3VUZ0_9ACTN|nr:hypothetical protein [Acrocarpospora corrugata]GER99491.1 hypothetical protein Acor_15550 [Acrocarpospora corrugata]